MPETPEQKARREIDAKLTASGWLVNNRDELDITAGRGIAVREFPMEDPNDEPASALLQRIAAEREERARAAKVAKQVKPKTKTARTLTAKI